MSISFFWIEKRPLKPLMLIKKINLEWLSKFISIYKINVPKFQIVVGISHYCLSVFWGKIIVYLASYFLLHCTSKWHSCRIQNFTFESIVLYFKTIAFICNFYFLNFIDLLLVVQLLPKICIEQHIHWNMLLLQLLMSCLNCLHFSVDNGRLCYFARICPNVHRFTDQAHVTNDRKVDNKAIKH